MTTDKEIIPEVRDELKLKIKVISIWALVEAAVTGMTTSLRDNDPKKMNLNQLSCLFMSHFIPEKISQ